MANKLNIDELLKQELADFHPDAPSGAWDAINQSLPNVAAQTAAAGKAGAMATVKIVAAIVTVAASVTAGLFLLSNQDKTATKSVVNPVAPLTTQANKNEIEVTASALEVSNNTSSKLNESKTNKNLPSEQTRSVKNQQPVITTNSDVKSAVLIQQPIETSDKQNGATLAVKQDLVSSELVDRNQTETKSTEEQKPAVTDYNEYSEPNIPNVFTPNNDGYNDEYVITIENEIAYDLKIMDAKGNVVFESKDKNVHWAGVNQRSGNTCEPGVYVFAFRYQLKGMNEAKVKQGRILLKL